MREKINYRWQHQNEIHVIPNLSEFYAFIEFYNGNILGLFPNVCFL